MNDSANEHQEALAHKAVVERLWTKPLLEQCAPLLELPDGSSVLVAEARCGLVPIEVSEHVSEETRIIALDPSRSMLDQARQRVDDDLQRQIFFVPQRVNSLSYADDVFKTSLCLNGIITVRQLGEGLSELARVTASGGMVVLGVPLHGSFPEFYDMLDEALRAHKLHDVLGRMYELRDSFITPARLVDVAERCGLHDVEITEISWRVSFESGQELLMSPMIRETFFPHWIGIIRSSDREPILRYIADAIDTYWHNRDFTCEIVAGCMVGRR